MIPKTKKLIAFILALVMLLSMTGCNVNNIIDSLVAQAGVSVVAGERLHNSTWINSDLEGSIDETTPLDLKDDFHTAVNRDWFLENDMEGEEAITSFTSVTDVLRENIFQILTPGTSATPDPNVMSQETLDHLNNLIWDMMDLAGNWDTRDALGAQPLAPYLEAIHNIDSMEDMTAYLCNRDGMNFTTESFFNPFVYTPINQRDYYTVHIVYPNNLLLMDPGSYVYLTFEEHQAALVKQEALHYVLGQLGCTQAQVDELLMRCYKFECAIAPHLSTNSARQEQSYTEKRDTPYTLEEIQQMQGNFPLDQILLELGMDHSNTFRLYEKEFLRYMSSIYNEKHLEDFKAYFLVHTVINALPYLDSTCREYNATIQNYLSRNYNALPEAETTEEDPEALQTELYIDYISPLLGEVFQLSYIGRYCSSEMKQEILAMLEDIRDYFEVMLSSTEWLTPATREKAIEKLHKMEFKALYPDELTDYSGLVYGGYDDGGDLIQAVANINRYQLGLNNHKINQTVTRADWNLTTMPTVDVNAMYELTSNSIIILAGIVSDGFFYDVNAPLETNYARLGMVLGHEMTHAFDTGGYLYDGDGLQNHWWTNEDEVAFRTRSDRLANHYSLLTTLPGAVNYYDGQLVQGEAIADMGGLKCMLALAEEIPDFDYELFFISYANVWRTQTSLRGEMTAASDVHPLGFLRTNVTLQQFEKFYETFDIGPGDGMYLAPEDRIMVW